VGGKSLRRAWSAEELERRLVKIKEQEQKSKQKSLIM